MIIHSANAEVKEKRARAREPSKYNTIVTDSDSKLEIDVCICLPGNTSSFTFITFCYGIKLQCTHEARATQFYTNIYILHAYTHAEIHWKSAPAYMNTYILPTKPKKKKIKYRRTEKFWVYRVQIYSKSPTVFYTYILWDLLYSL